MQVPSQVDSKWKLSDRQTSVLINVLSIAVPVVVAFLLSLGQSRVNLGEWTRYLPHINGVINTATSVLLAMGWIAIRSRKISWHRLCMTSAFSLGAVFLVCYVTYHLSNESTKFGGTGFVRWLYYFVLISHIALSLVVLPLVLRAFIYALAGKFERHRRIARFAIPIWLYVSVTGVIAYLMISPYYKS